LGTCLYTGGDIATTLGIRSSISDLGAVGTAFNGISSLTDPNSDVIIFAILI
jgi:hypothetical protein